MTGDGVNDMLAMKESDCGIAIAGGAQAASQVARMVLLNSDFAAMPSIVGEGRRVINNIQRAAALFLVKNIFSLGTTLFTLFSASAYPLNPMHMSIISGLTIGVPSFLLAMEPNYERVQGKFIPTVLRKALPGGLTNVAVALILQAVSGVFELNPVQISTICTASLSVVGLLVLHQVCTPFDKFRKGIWILTAALLFASFVVTGEFFELNFGNLNGFLVLLVLLTICPAIFFVMDRLFFLIDKLIAKCKKK
jgi:cation-transporting ATPase E